MPNIDELVDSYFALLEEVKEGGANEDELIERLEILADEAEKVDGKIGHHLAAVCRDNVASIARGEFQGQSDTELQRLLDGGRG